MAAQSVGKVWMLRHEIQGVPLPDGLRRAAPGGRGGRRAGTRRVRRVVPDEVQDPHQQGGPGAEPDLLVRPRHDAGHRLELAGQAEEPVLLGPPPRHHVSAGTAITDMVRVVNNKTDYDDEAHAGPYVVLDISDFTFKQWYRLMMRHIHDYQAPVVLHPVLLKQYYPYLDDDASGHFQVGRGFDQDPGGNRKIGYFEPWDQSRFDPSEPAIEPRPVAQRLQVLPRQPRPLPAQHRRLTCGSVRRSRWRCWSRSPAAADRRPDARRRAPTSRRAARASPAASRRPTLPSGGTDRRTRRRSSPRRRSSTGPTPASRPAPATSRARSGRRSAASDNSQRRAGAATATRSASRRAAAAPSPRS